MEVADIHIKSRKNRHCFLYCIWNVMQFQVPEDLMSACFDLADDIRTCSIEQFHTDFHKWFFACKSI